MDQNTQGGQGPHTHIKAWLRNLTRTGAGTLGLTQTLLGIIPLLFALISVDELPDASGKEVAFLIFLFALGTLSSLFGIIIIRMGITSNLRKWPIKKAAITFALLLLVYGGYSIFLDVGLSVPNRTAPGILSILTGLALLTASALIHNPQPGSDTVGGITGIIAASLFLATIIQLSPQQLSILNTGSLMPAPTVFGNASSATALILAGIGGFAYTRARGQRYTPAALLLVALAALLLGIGTLIDSVDALSQDPWDAFSHVETEAAVALVVHIATYITGIVASTLILAAAVLGLTYYGTQTYRLLEQPLNHSTTQTTANPGPPAQHADRCRSCGTELETETQYCTSCGEEVQETTSNACPQCGADTNPDDNFCGECGTLLNEGG